MEFSGRHRKDLNVIPDAIGQFDTEAVLSVFERMTRARAFEECIVRACASGKFKIKIHMSSGQEAAAAAVGMAAWDYQIFTQHRTMDLYLSLGGDACRLRDEILCLDSGTSGGRQGGAFQLFENGRRMYAHTGLIGENIPVGVGAALGNGEKTLCYFGDGAAEEDYALSAYGFAVTHKLPVLFLCTDNELSVLSGKEKRRSWELDELARGFGMESIDVSDDPFTLMLLIKKYESCLPAFINVRVCRNYWHAGVGIDEAPAWDRYIILREKLVQMGLEKEAAHIQKAELEKMEDVWHDYL